MAESKSSSKIIKIMELNIYLKKAQKEKWAIGQFNISNLETLRAVIQAAKKLKSPVIIGTSEGESRFLGLKQTVALIKSFKEESGLPLFLNLDHGKTFDYIKKTLEMGYDTVHFDGSKLPLVENIKLTKKIVALAHKIDVSVEGEVGFIKGSSQILKKAPKIKKEDLTSPEEALKFVNATGVDRLAINIGTFHGIGVSGRKHINLKRLKEIKEKIGVCFPEVFLVLHGGSIIPEKELKTAIKLGIVKININTELRIVYTNTLKKVFKENPKETTPYKYLQEVVSAVQKVVEEKIKLFASVNKA